MPQIQVNSASIIDFGYDVDINIYTRTMRLSIATLTNFDGAGGDNILGVAFHVEDSLGIVLAAVDWDNPQIEAGDTFYDLDLSSSPVNFLFQSYKFIGYIKDEDGTIYETVPVIKNICQPANINESGYVPGDFEIIPDCINNTLTVKEFTPLVYNKCTPYSTTKSGTLSYPTGTIAAVAFASTPFSNNHVYTGEYRIVNTTTAKYDLGDDIYVSVTYITDRPFDVTCSNFIGDITCCLTDVYNTYLKNCDNATGQAALQKYNGVLPSILNGLVKQVNGQDASLEVAEIKKQLNCDCGKTSLRQNEGVPTNPSIYSIVLNGVGGTTIPAPSITGNTKTYSIASQSYVVSKADIGDLAYTITTSVVGYVTTYKIKFNYAVMADYLLDAIAASPTLINQLNALVTAGNSIAGLDGKCVIDLTESDYAVSQAVTGSTLITNIVINGTIYAAPGSLFADNATAVASWLNSLTKGTFTAIVNSGTLTIISVSNTNTISTISFTTPDITKQFASTNATLVQVLQALVDYLCTLTSLQVALSGQLTLCTFDYNGEIVNTIYGAGSPQQWFNAGVASAICNITARIDTLTGITCAKLQEIFIDRATALFGADDRIFGTLGGNCAGITDYQMAKMIIAAVGKYSDVKTLWCAIDCTAAGTCPDVTNISLGMSGSNVGVYGITWATTPNAAQTVTLRYRTAGTLPWYVLTTSMVILPNGNLSGTSPYLIQSIIAGTTIDVWIANNCGGSGFVKQITVPTGSVYQGDYLLNNILYDICGGTPVTLYSSQPFASGVTMYTDIGMTTPVTGYIYITIPGSNIFGINTSTGVVGTDTGSSCANGTEGSYKLGNSTSTICDAVAATRYTDGIFAVGKTLYTDAALTTPQTGYSYVVYNNIIYNVTSGTGVIGVSTGLNCSAASATGNAAIDASASADEIGAIRFNSMSAAASGGYYILNGTTKAVTIQNAALNGTLEVDIFSHTGSDTRIEVVDSNSNFQCSTITGNGTKTFLLFDVTEGGSFSIHIKVGGNCP